MSGDHNMNQTNWRKRQSALDKKAENARELRLNYEPDKTIMEMAREAEVTYSQVDGSYKKLEAFAALVRKDEREACAKVCDEKVDAEYATGKVDHNEMGWTQSCAIAIRARSNT